MKIRLLTAAVLCLAGLTVPRHALSQAPAPGAPAPAQLEVGQPFPDFTATELNGKAASVGAFKGKVVLVDFWATWCGPCVAELPHVLKTYEKFHPKGFEVVGISLDRDKNKLTKFIAAKKIPWVQVLDNKGELAQRYSVQFIPLTVLVGKDGKILAIGARGEQLEAAVAQAIAGK